jgi:hypothetical protein
MVQRSSSSTTLVAAPCREFWNIVRTFNFVAVHTLALGFVATQRILMIHHRSQLGFIRFVCAQARAGKRIGPRRRQKPTTAV